MAWGWEQVSRRSNTGRYEGWGLQVETHQKATEAEVTLKVLLLHPSWARVEFQFPIPIYFAVSSPFPRFDRTTESTDRGGAAMNGKNRASILNSSMTVGPK